MITLVIMVSSIAAGQLFHTHTQAHTHSQWLSSVFLIVASATLLLRLLLLSLYLARDFHSPALSLVYGRGQCEEWSSSWSPAILSS